MLSTPRNAQNARAYWILRKTDQAIDLGGPDQISLMIKDNKITCTISLFKIEVAFEVVPPAEKNIAYNWRYYDTSWILL